ncbi:tyrosine-type recombinase/integrase [Thalassobaculum sp.]|uniref:tyrosine-type recombinase/integrase n=1 Tax=Thalassobaculum sp. TaxID=2022740 RepID=UPI003B5A325E
MALAPRGRPGRYAEYDHFYASLTVPMEKRPRYIHGIGVFRGRRGDTAWVKIHLPRGATYGGKSYPPGSSIEIKQGHLTSYTWQQLLDVRDRLQGLADRGEPLEAVRPSVFREYASAWLERAQQRLRSYAVVKIHVEKHLIPQFGSQTLDAITTANVNTWVASKLETQKPATVKRELDTLSMILNEAVREGTLDENPCNRANRIRGIVGRQSYLTGEQIVSLLAAADAEADWLADFILWSLHSGMRKTETLSLTWNDVRELGEGRTICLIPKSKSDTARQVPCTATMQTVLERQKARTVPGDERVFPIARMTLRRRWERTREAAGLPGYTIHDLRRTHSTHAAVAGVDLRTLADRIGHSDLTMLQRHYTALVGDAASEAARIIEARFQSVTEPTK